MRSKINNTFIDNAEDLDIVMAIYRLLEHNDNYFMSTEGLWGYYRDELNDDANKIDAADNNSQNNDQVITNKSVKYRARIIGSTPVDNNALDTKVVIPLIYLSSF